jgi:acid phosphatase family membrane protein YuiD
MLKPRGQCVLLDQQIDELRSRVAETCFVAEITCHEIVGVVAGLQVMLDAQGVAHQAGLQAVVGFEQQAGYESEDVATPDQVVEVPDRFVTAVYSHDFGSAA